MVPWHQFPVYLTLTKACIYARNHTLRTPYLEKATSQKKRVYQKLHKGLKSILLLREFAKEKTTSKNYFTSSDPHHDMLGGGCQVRVVIENMMGRRENLRTLISGFLGLVILVRWALVTMFLSWTTQTGCRIHRTYVSLIGSGEGRHTTHLLKCVPLLSTSQTDWKQSSDVLSDISFDILSDISSDIFFWYIFWHSFWHIFWHSFWHLSDISFDILSDKSFDALSDISSDILSDISFDMLSDISSDILSDISKRKPNIHSFTKKAALQTLYLPRTTQQK